MDSGRVENKYFLIKWWLFVESEQHEEKRREGGGPGKK